jgi:HSP20 family protein
MNRLLEAGLQNHTTAAWMPNRQPSLNLYESDEHYTVVVETPGVSADSVHLDATEEVLTLTGSRSAPEKVEDERYRRQERWHGDWKREVPFPSRINPEGITAELKDGLLTIVAPKAQESRPRRINISLPQQ